jgi:hypothetical protein
MFFVCLKLIFEYIFMSSLISKKTSNTARLLLHVCQICKNISLNFRCIRQHALRDSFWVIQVPAGVRLLFISALLR